MKFRDDTQKNAAIHALLGRTLGDLWTPTGPTSFARQLAVGTSITTSRRDLTLARIALQIYDKSSDALFSDIADLPEHDRNRLAGLLKAQCNHFAIDRWIRRQRLIPIRGEQLRALKVADPDKWRVIVSDVILAAESTQHAVDLLDVSMRTFWRWRAEPEIAKVFDARGWKEEGAAKAAVGE